MSDALWPEAKSIVAEALERPESERTSFLDRRCASRSDLRGEVESLLEAHRRAGTFIEEPFVPAAPGDESEDNGGDELPLHSGAQVGSYRLLRELGRGGMGIVYLAERADSAFDTHVAVKIVAGHVAAPDLIRRFLDERRILATLSHPNIAHILDAGATDEGVPFVVMEYVDGSTIDEHCRSRKLSLRQRLNLFRQVCDAVHYAHQHLIVHRDIKAANILVTGDGVPKLLDFGIARLLEDGRVRTDTALRAFTPESASPEQLQNEAVTITSDVYSLGALLYRLLTDRKVFDFSSSSDTEILRMICEQDPMPPSIAAVVSAGHGERVARDLDWITLKALRKEPGRRYVSAAQLSEDCERYLTGQAVLAAPDSVRYRTSKFIRRHFVGVAAAAVIAVTLSGAGAVVWYQRQRAERRFNDVRQLANTLVGELYDAIAEVPGTTTARKLLVTRALGYLDALGREAGNDLSLKRDLADAYQKIGDVQGNPYGANLGDVPGARDSYNKLVDLRSAIHEASRRNRQSAIALGRAYSRVGDLDLAQGEYPRAVESYQRAHALLAPGSPQNGAVDADDALEDRARVRGRLGVAFTWAGRRDEAKAALLESIRLTEQLSDRPGSSRLMRRGLAVNHGNLGDVYHYQGDFPKALASHQRAADIARSLLSEAPEAVTAKRDVVMLLARVGADYVELGQHDEAIRATEESIAIEKTLVAADPLNIQFQFDLADMYGNLATSQRETRQLDAALESIEQSIRISEGATAKNPDYVAHRFNFAGEVRQLGLVQRDRGAMTEAIRAFRRSVALFESLPADQRDPKQSLAPAGDLGLALATVARRSGSRDAWREASTALRHALNGWEAYKRGAGAKEDLRLEIDPLAAALQEADLAAGTPAPAQLTR
ncbi:MAG: serine/threonine-protein kinase [Vicinamibacterales bacterium]